jgi:hypothetical protein
LPLQTALDNLFADEKAKAPTVIIGGAPIDDGPVIQPGSQPNAPAVGTDEAPALRDMPEDF